MIANEKSSKTLAQANGISLNLKMPMLNTKQSKAIENDVWGGSQNQALCVERHRANATTPYQAYIMIYGNNAENGSIGQNIGQVIDLVEGKQEELSYGGNWTIVEFTATDEILSYNSIIDQNGLKAVVVFWGDGTVNRYTPAQNSSSVTISHTYSMEGTYTIRYFVY